MEERNKSIDLLKVIAVIAIIIIHAKTFKGMGGNFEILYSIVETIARIAVPIFFFFNGYYFYKGYQKYGSFYYKKFCIKIIKIHIIAGIVYKSYITIDKFISNNKLDLSLFDIKKIMIEFIYRGFYFHLWYLPAIIIIITVLYLFIKIKKVNMLFKIALFIYCFGVICSENVFNNILHISMMPYRENKISLGIIFVVLGYLYSEDKNSVKKYFKFNSFFLIVILLIERLIVYLLTGNKEVICMYFTLIPVTYFLVDYFINKDILINNKFILKYGKESIGIYLYHCLGMIIVWKIYNYLKIKPENLIYHILILPGSYIFAYYIYYYLEKIIKIISFKLKRENKYFYNKKGE